MITQDMTMIILLIEFLVFFSFIMGAIVYDFYLTVLMHSNKRKNTPTLKQCNIINELMER